MTEQASAPAQAQSIGLSNDGVKAPEQPDFKGTKHKVTVNGKTLEVPYEDLLTDYQLKAASYQKLREASELSKQTQPLKEFVESLTKGDLSHLKKIVPEETLRKWAEQELGEFIEWNEKPETERQKILAERERDSLKQRLQEIEAEKERQQMAILEQQEAARIDTQIAEAVQELGEDVKVTPRLIRRIAEQLMAAADLDPKVAAKRAWAGLQKDYEEYQTRLFSRDPGKYVESLPKDIREAIRKHELKQAIDKQPAWARKPGSDKVVRKPKSSIKGFDALEDFYKRKG